MRELKGWHVLAFTSGCFAIVIAVNGVLAWKAVSTFPGLEVANSYVASQTFDAEKHAQEGLGWTLVDAYAPGDLRLTFTGRDGLPIAVEGLTVLIGRPTETTDDIAPVFADAGAAYVAPVTLRPGKWMMRVEAHAADGTLFRQRRDLFVRG